MQPREEFTPGKAASKVGLYHNPVLDKYIGCVDPAQADAVKNHGYNLVKEGIKAANWTEVQIAAAVEKAKAKNAESDSTEPAALEGAGETTEEV